MYIFTALLNGRQVAINIHTGYEYTLTLGGFQSFEKCFWWYGLVREYYIPPRISGRLKFQLVVILTHILNVQEEMNFDNTRAGHNHSDERPDVNFELDRERGRREHIQMSLNIQNKIF